MSGVNATLSFAFASGGTKFDALQGDSVEVRIDVPRVGYQRMLDSTTFAVDPARLEITSDRDWGAPSAGGIAAGTPLTQFMIDQDWLAVSDPGGDVREIRIVMNSGSPLEFPSGLMRLSMQVTDDIDRTTTPFVVELTLISVERPTLSLRFESPPTGSTPTGQSLPLDDNGNAFVGESLPFALIVEGIPNPTTLAGFTLLFGQNGIDPARLVVTADQDLGDPGNGGIAAGTNLASLFATDIDFILDPDTGRFVTGMLFPIDATFNPLLGTVVFSATVLDDSDVESDLQVAGLDSVPRVTLSGNVQPIFSAHCGFSCHDGDFPVLDLNLSDGESWSHAVNVRAKETPEDSCATLRVAPYDSDASYLFHKISGTHLGGCVNGSGDQMPLGLPLGQEDRDLIEEWILQGAMDE